MKLMSHKEPLSISEKLLLAAYDLEKKGQRPFSAEDLVVSAWQKYPDAFGLAGYRNKDGKLSYPDSNRVFAEIMGSKPIRKQGFFTKVGTKMYNLTEAGRERARLLLERPSGKSPVKKAALAREIEAELKRLFASKVWKKVKSDHIGDITFYDACAFWGISPRSSAIELQGRFANFQKVVESAQKVIYGEKATFEHSGNVFGSKELNTLLKIHQELLRKFQDEVNVIKKRTDERV